MDHAQPALQNVVTIEAVKNYVLVAKPWMVVDNLVSASGGFFLAAQGHVAINLYASVLMGMSCVVSSACVFNNYIDRYIDKGMDRTCRRVLATGAISQRGSLIYATFLGIAGAAILSAGTNTLTLTIALAGFAIYVGAYSLYLKRNSVYSTVVGSLAGAAPPLAAYCAISNCIDAGAILVLIVFSLWQIPHSYAITIYRYDDYSAVAIPVMPVKMSIETTKKHIVWHIAAFMLAAQMLTVFGYTGYAFLAVATTLGLCWLCMALSGYKDCDNRLWARRLYVFSILAVFILSVMMSIDYGGPHDLSNAL